MWSCLTGCWMYTKRNDMRLILSFLLSIGVQVCFGQADSLVSQSLITYRDTTDHVELVSLQPGKWKIINSRR